MANEEIRYFFLSDVLYLKKIVQCLIFLLLFIKWGTPSRKGLMDEIFAEYIFAVVRCKSCESRRTYFRGWGNICEFRGINISDVLNFWDNNNKILHIKIDRILSVK